MFMHSVLTCNCNTELHAPATAQDVTDNAYTVTMKSPSCTQLQPAYEDVCSGRTGHTEAVLVFYDAKEVHYSQLLDVFFGRIDPTQASHL
jgi:peptide methionine sulfoxide reductase MsrA